MEPFTCQEVLTEILTALRKRKMDLGLSQVDVAALLSISPDAYRKTENGENRMSLHRFFEVCRILDTSPKAFIDETYLPLMEKEVLEMENGRLRSAIQDLREDIQYLRTLNLELLNKLPSESGSMRVIR